MTTALHRVYVTDHTLEVIEVALITAAEATPFPREFDHARELVEGWRDRTLIADHFGIGRVS